MSSLKEDIAQAAELVEQNRGPEALLLLRKAHGMSIPDAKNAIAEYMESSKSAVAQMAGAEAVVDDAVDMITAFDELTADVLRMARKAGVRISNINESTPSDSEIAEKCDSIVECMLWMIERDINPTTVLRWYVADGIKAKIDQATGILSRSRLLSITQAVNVPKTSLRDDLLTLL